MREEGGKGEELEMTYNLQMKYANTSSRQQAIREDIERIGKMKKF